MKNYETPVLEEDQIELTDICADSGLSSFGGDSSQSWGSDGDFM